MSKAVVVRYQTKEDRADENQRLIENVLAELNQNRPDGMRYASFRLADGVTFVHIGVFDGDSTPLTEVAAFAEFQKGIGDRVAESPVPSDATLIGSYRFAD
jgi:hypothetical protein